MHIFARMMSLALIVGMAGVAHAQDRERVAAASTVATRAGDVDLHRRCKYGLEGILPGDYYFCRAVHSFWDGHDKKAIEQLKEAAHWANKKAQHALGAMYFQGDHAPLNRPLGLAWLALAAERDDPAYEKTYARAVLSATPTERVRGGELWKRMQAEYGDAVAGKRARRKFERTMQPLREMENSSTGCIPTKKGCVWGGVFIPGLSMAPGSATVLIKKLQTLGDQYFEGMQGTVSVGPLSHAEDPGSSAQGEPHGHQRNP